MDEYHIELGITKLADNELKDETERDEIVSAISKEKKYKFDFDVQQVISRNIKESIVKYPVPLSLNKKLIRILSQGELK